MEVTHADRVVFPETGTTKGDVVAYYESVGESMLPFLAGRALTVERYPKGTQVKGFMQKNAPEHFSDDVIDRHEVPKEDGGTTVYPVVHHSSAIAAFANLGVITFHVPPAKVDDEFHSDWMIWDLDPTSGDFSRVRDAAHALRSVLEGFGIEPVLMTSGSNGYHLRSSLDPKMDAEVAARVARGTSALAATAHPKLMTLEFRKKERSDRVFVDWLRNAPYSTSVVPWSLRARPSAPVAVPIAWDELGEVDPDGITIDDVAERVGLDIWGDYQSQDLSGVLRSVEEALAEAGIQLEPFDRFRS